MQKLLLLPALAGVLLTACQPSGKPAGEKIAAAPVAPAPADTLPAPPDSSVTAAVEEPIEELPSRAYEKHPLSVAEMQQLLAKHDLAVLWAMQQRKGAAVYNGFYGPERYRIEMYFASVTRDSLRPDQLHVTGKSRYKKNITPFSGTITIDSLAALRVIKGPEDADVDLGTDQSYLALGRFTLREDSLAGAGQFEGKLLMDFSVSQEGNMAFDYFLKTPTRFAGFLFEGEWRSYRTGQARPVLWADNFFALAQGVLKNFNIGERDVEINPAYRHLGWDTYWSEEEWWNEPAPVLQ